MAIWRLRRWLGGWRRLGTRLRELADWQRLQPGLRQLVNWRVWAAALRQLVSWRAWASGLRRLASALRRLVSWRRLGPRLRRLANWRALASWLRRLVSWRRLKPRLLKLAGLWPKPKSWRRLWPRHPARALAAVLALLAAGAVLALGYLQYQLSAGISAEGAFVVAKGEAEDGTVRRLRAEGRLPLPLVALRLGLRFTASEGPIQTGEYAIPAGRSAYEVLGMLRSGKVKQYSVTFPEGWRLSQWREQLARQPALQQTIASLSDAELASRLGLKGSLEGWLFPDTYQFSRGDRDLQLLQRAHQAMQSRLAQLWDPATAPATLESPYQLLTLASIVEKESGRPADRALIASVFHNRLREDMRLQSDPTTIYALGDAFDGDLRRSHLSMQHPFNTYRNKGLTPTPICNPGLDALRAAFSPPQTHYLYFVAKGNGESHFSVTLQEHNAAVARYQLGQQR